MQNYSTRQVFIFMKHQQFFKATYWVMAIIDHNHGVPLEKESNYIFVKVAKCKLISNLLAAPLFFSWDQGQSCRSGKPNHCTETGNLTRLCPFIQQVGTEDLAFCMYQLCSRSQTHRCKQDNVSFLLEFPKVLTNSKSHQVQNVPELI